MGIGYYVIFKTFLLEVGCVLANINDIANACGVSRQTAGLILSGRTDLPYKLSTRQRVLDTAKKMGYQPHGAAQSMAKGKFNAIGLLHDTMQGRSYFPQALTLGVEKMILKQGLSLLLSALATDEESWGNRLPRILTHLSCDGMLINYHGLIPDHMNDALQQQGVPCVWINTVSKTDAVYFDESAGIKKAVEHLIELGHRQIVYVTNHISPSREVKPHYSMGERLSSYKAIMKKSGLKPLVISYDGDRLVRPHQYIPEILNAWPDKKSPTACISALSTQGTAALVLALQRLGFQVPKDISLIAISDAGQLDIGLPVTTLVQPWGGLGGAAVKLLFERMEASKTVKAQSIELNWVPGDSVIAH